MKIYKKPHPSPGTFLAYTIPFLPYSIAFFSSMALMTIELIAGRIIGSHLGNSFYTWAAIIGVILCGNSLGNYWGGKMSHRKPSFLLLARLILLAALSCVLIFIFNRIFAQYISLPWLFWPARIFGTVLVIFIMPALFLGAVTPVTSGLALEYSAQFGITIGNIYAWGAIGGICGALLTGFVLIAVLGSTQILLLISLILVLLALLLFSIHNHVPDYKRMAEPFYHEAAGANNIEPSRRSRLLNRVSGKYASRWLVFCSSGSLMMTELLGGRLISRYFGNSLYSWTSIIGVVLTGMTLGYFIGGRLAQERQPQKYLAPLFTAASLLTLFISVAMNFLWVSTWLNKLSLPWQILLTITCTMLLPAVVLGAVSPITCRLACQPVFKHSVTPTAAFIIGSLNAWAVAGSFCGTLGAGFFLIPVFGAVKALVSLALFLAITALWLSSRRWLISAWLLLLMVTFWATAAGPESLPVQALEYTQMLGLRPESKDMLFAGDSNYQYVKVYQNSLNTRHDIRTLALDSLIHGYVDLKDPVNLCYEYEHIYRNLTHYYAAGKTRFNAFFIGAGSYTFPRWMLFQWPEAQITVAEIDPLVVAANHLALGLPKDTPIRTIIGDARNVISGLPAGEKYDLFYGDAFNDLSVPWHLTTLEFVKRIKSHLKPGGAYMLNVIDNYDNGLLVGASYLTLRKIFRHVYIFCTNPLRIQNLRDTFILLASDQPIDTSRWTSKSGDYSDGVLLTPKNLNYLAQRCNGLILTDNFAPVENLIAPVVRKRKFR
jgi:spermidine synthase